MWLIQFFFNKCNIRIYNIRVKTLRSPLSAEFFEVLRVEWLRWRIGCSMPAFALVTERRNNIFEKKILMNNNSFPRVVSNSQQSRYNQTLLPLHYDASWQMAPAPASYYLDLKYLILLVILLFLVWKCLFTYGDFLLTIDLPKFKQNKNICNATHSESFL